MFLIVILQRFFQVLALYYINCKCRRKQGLVIMFFTT